MYLRLKLGLIVFAHILAGCNLPVTKHPPKEVNKKHMIEVARHHDCLHLFPDTTTFDGCIYRIQPYFDQLPLKEKQEVALNFVIYGNLQAGPSIMFAELISPCNTQIIKYLRDVPNDRLQKDFWVWPWQWSDYRKQVNKFAEYNLPRGSNRVDFPEVECNLSNP